MGTRMLLFPGEEHMHRAPSSTWGGMHEPDVGNPPWMSGYNSQSSGGNTWSKRLAANSSNNSSSTNNNNNNNNNSDSDSWEVRAFAEDASTSGQWPPRSYSCSFCQREFRTAQALGGHMNVHRRERAQANQLAQLRSTGTEAQYSNPHNLINVNPSSTPPDHGHWLPRDSTSHVIAHDHQYASSSNPYDRYASSAVVDDSYLHSASYGTPSSYGAPTSYGAPSSPSFRNSDPYEYRSSYDTPPRGDAGLDLELRLGQRYD